MSPAACWPPRSRRKFSTLPQNLQFLSLTFVGMTVGSLITGFVGDCFGRRFTYQINLLIFGLASLAAAFAQNMDSAHRLPLRAGAWARRRDRRRLFDPDRIRAAEDRAAAGCPSWPSSSSPVSRSPPILGYLIIPSFGWRPMFIIAGVGSLIVWYLRKALPESPRWLELQGRDRGSRSLDASDRTGSGRRRHAAAGGRRRPRRRKSPASTCSSRRCCSA